MPLRYAANLSMLWTDRETYARFDAAVEAGFGLVEMLFPQALDVSEVERLLAEHGLRLALFDLHAGDWNAGERGIAALPDRVDEWRDHVADDLQLAARLGTPTLAVLAGIVPDGLPGDVADQTLINNLAAMAGPSAELGITLTLEPINHTDVPGYHVRSAAHAARIVAAVDHPNVGIQFDQYHVSMEHEDPVAQLEQHIGRIGHVQIADAPGRHEPGTGAAPIAAFLGRLEALDYDGVVGLEYRPSRDTDASLAWLARTLRR